jgi:hypothetical protein
MAVTFPATADAGNVITLLNIASQTAKVVAGGSGSIYGKTGNACPTSGSTQCELEAFAVASFIYNGAAWYLLNTNGGVLNGGGTTTADPPIF